MTKIKMPNIEAPVDLDDLFELETLNECPSDAIHSFISEKAADDIFSSCSQITIDEIGEALIFFGKAMASGAPPSLRLDFDIVDGDGQDSVTGKVIVQGRTTQSFSGPSLPAVVVSTMRATAEQNAYSATGNDATRITVLTEWSRSLFVVSKMIEDSCNSMLVASEMRLDRLEKENDT